MADFYLLFREMTWALQTNSRLKKGRADIYFSRSVGKDIPARPHPACCVGRTL